MTDPRSSLNRRSFLKRAGAATGVFTTASLLSPRLPVGADVLSGSVSATASDSGAIERFSVVRWDGPGDAVVQLRQLQIFGTWSTWQTVDHWSDVAGNAGQSQTSGLIRTNGAQALQARCLTPGVSGLSIVGVPATTSNSSVGG